MSENPLFNFDQQVKEASFQTPVLVDFWATWCGPCRVIGPILEKLAEEEASRESPAWTLVKVDTDKHPEIAQQYQVRGIPNMKLFHEGKVIAELTGALPETAVREWLGRELPNPAKADLEAGKAALDDGDDVGAAVHFQQAYDAGIQEAGLFLARALLLHHPKKAGVLVEHGGLSDLEVAIRTTAAYLQEDPSQWPSGPAKQFFADGLTALRNRKFGEALEQLIRAIAVEKNWHDDAARKQVVAIFHLLGNQHPLVIEHRRAFSMALT